MSLHSFTQARLTELGNAGEAQETLSIDYAAAQQMRSMRRPHRLTQLDDNDWLQCDQLIKTDASRWLLLGLTVEFQPAQL